MTLKISLGFGSGVNLIEFYVGPTSGQLSPIPTTLPLLTQQRWFPLRRWHCIKSFFDFAATKKQKTEFILNKSSLRIDGLQIEKVGVRHNYRSETDIRSQRRQHGDAKDRDGIKAARCYAQEPDTALCTIYRETGSINRHMRCWLDSSPKVTAWALGKLIGFWQEFWWILRSNIWVLEKSSIII